ncbi:DNA translocase FtsK 4TM domain-containing protein [Lentisphaera profundi]|uniref:DNA translocase FtsK 4TM domain-containing protein n=1 Tax=Lentisphaera profundi TaxID=1658616 RepID=A0ABY7VV47_9BACT|nr:DNA translocase FtsK 4TM domain-containing protein [Lentisphaera profundi]WDE98100.1 DNA translocase FtsK 4TM domain-containing protein [Lentisphaera profundi]
MESPNTLFHKTKERGLHTLIFTLLLMVFISVISYTPSDISAITGGKLEHQYSNLFGALGARISYFMFLSFGLGAYPITILIFSSAVRRLLNLNIHKTNWIYFLSIIFFASGISTCLGCYPDFMPSLCKSLNISQIPGGALGSLLANPEHGWLYHICNRLGCVILSLALISYSLYVFMSFDWPKQHTEKVDADDEPSFTPNNSNTIQDEEKEKNTFAQLKNTLASWFQTKHDESDALQEVSSEAAPEYLPAVSEEISTLEKAPEPSPRKSSKKNKEALGEQELPLADTLPLEENLDHIIEDEKPHEIFSGQLTEPQQSTQTTRYKLPSLDLLTNGDSEIKISPEEVQRKKDIIQETLEHFKIKAHMGEAFPGPRITLYEIIPDKGVRIEKISSISNNLSMELQAQMGIRIITPIPGRRSVGVEVPNDEASSVWLRAMVETKDFKNSDAMIPIVLGKDISGNTSVMDLARAPHLLIAGATGAGKSVFMNCLIMSLLYRFTPDELELILVDPKKVEFAPYANIPHLVCPIITEAEQVPSALRWASFEMDVRYDLLAAVGVRNLSDFNNRKKKPTEPTEDKNGNSIPEKLPLTVIIVDEVADLMSNKNTRAEIENSISRIAAKARAVGIHLVLATQSPRTNVITGVIKANFPTRIAFQVSSYTDSMTILDGKGAEQLLGRGDMLFNPPASSNLLRIQSAWTPDEDIEKVVEFISKQQSQRFKDIVKTGSAEIANGTDGEDYASDDEQQDSIISQAMDIIRRDKKTSISYLQRKMRIGYNKAANIIEELEDIGFLSAADHTGKREILDDIYKNPEEPS